MSGLEVPEVRATLDRHHTAAAKDPPAIARGFARALGRSTEPNDFAEAYIDISAEQGHLLYGLAIAVRAR